MVLRRLGVVGALVLGLAGCSDENSPPVPEEPGTFLLDHTWQVRTTTLLTTGSEGVPFPAPDVLDGSLARFGADRRVLVEPPGFEEFQDLGARYSVMDASVVRLQLGRGLWFPYEYHFDRASGVLLLNPETLAGDSVVGFVRDVVSQILARGDDDGAAAAFTDGLYRDASVASAVENFLSTTVHGDAGTGPAPEKAAATLYGALAPSGVFEPTLDEDSVVEALAPMATELASLESGKLTNRLVDDLLDSDVLDATLMLDRAEQLIRYALYQRVLATTANLAAVERIEIELETAD